MAVMNLIAPVSLYVLVVSLTLSLGPGIELSWKTSADAYGPKILLSSVLLDLGSTSFPNSNHSVSGHIGLPKYWFAAYFKSRIRRYPNSSSTFQLARLVISGNISPNPGPVKCNVCSRTVARHHRAICCDSCGGMGHIKCGNAKPSEYKRIQQTNNINWICLECISMLHSVELPFHDIDIQDWLQIDCDYPSSSVENVSNLELTRNDPGNLEQGSEESPDLEEMRYTYRKELLMCHININSIQNEFEELQDIIQKAKVQVMIVSQSKIDSSYPDSQFHISGYSIHRNNRTKGGGGIMAFVFSSVQCKRLKLDKKYKTLEPVALEIGLRTRDVIVIGIYRPPRTVTHLLEEELHHI